MTAPTPPAVTLVFPIPLPLAATGETQSGREVRVVTQAFDVELLLWSGERFTLATIPAGFKSDGVSRPEALNDWLTPWGDEARAALLHDWFLSLIDSGQIGRPKMIVDLLFFLALVCTGVSFLRAGLMFLGVRTRARRR